MTNEVAVLEFSVLVSVVTRTTVISSDHSFEYYRSSSKLLKLFLTWHQLQLDFPKSVLFCVSMVGFLFDFFGLRI